VQRYSFPFLHLVPCPCFYAGLVGRRSAPFSASRLCLFRSVGPFLPPLFSKVLWALIWRLLSTLRLQDVIFPLPIFSVRGLFFDYLEAFRRVLMDRSSAALALFFSS